MGLLAAVSVVLALSYLSFGGAVLALADMRSVAQQRIDRYATLATRFATRTLENQAAVFETARWGGAASAFAPQPMPATSLCAGGATCGLSAVADYAIDGSIDAYDGTSAVVAPNVEQNARELRIAATMTVRVVDAGGAIVLSRPVRVKVRVFGPSGAELAEVQDTASRSTRGLAGSAENEGCATDGSGCDPDRVTASAATTIDAVQQCDAGGYGSGTCPGNGFIPYQNKAPVQWTNRQAGASTSGP